MEPVRLEDWSSIQTLVEMSIGTDRGTWWADPEFGSDLWKFRQSGKLVPEMVEDVRREILRCTAWIVADGLASKIECATEQAGRTRINWVTTVTRPEGSPVQIAGVWDGTE